MVLAGALGFAIIAQVRQTSIEGLENLREDELVRIFAGVDQDGDRLADEIRGLRDLARAAPEPVDERGRGAARRPASGWTRSASSPAPSPATGPGIVLTVSDPDDKVDAPIILDTVQELRDAGAEAIQIGGERVVADTWFADTDERAVASPAPRCARPTSSGPSATRNTLAGAMEIPGGVTATVRRVGGDTDVQIEDEVEVDALLTLTSPQYARPVPTPTP